MQLSTINNQHIFNCSGAVTIGKMLRKKTQKSGEDFGVLFFLKDEKMKKVTSRKNEVLKSREAEHMIYRVTQFPEKDSKLD